MKRSKIRGGIDASRRSRIALRSIRATHLKDRAKIASLRIFAVVIDFWLRSHCLSTSLRSNVSRQQGRRFNDLQCLTSPASATAFDNRRRIVLKAKLSRSPGTPSRGCFRKWSESGPRGRNDTLRTRAASGPRSSGTMTGPRGARCTGAGEGPPVCTRRFQETRPGAESGVTAWRAPRWSAERRARCDQRAAGLR